MLTEFVAFETAWNITDVADGTVNVIKKSLLFQIHKTEGVADIITAIVDDFWLGANLAQLLLKRVALQNGTVIVIIMEGDHTYSFFGHIILLGV